MFGRATTTAKLTPTPGCVKRLQKELARIQTSPPDFIVAAPDQDDLLVWYYVLEGPPDSPYEGGVYIGKLLFPATYPFAPPGIQMCTPNGRFEINRRLCLSISDFHPESWNPVWNVGTILVGLLSFMLENASAAGAIHTTKGDKRMYARDSPSFNLRTFPHVLQQLFPTKHKLCKDIVELGGVDVWVKRQAEQREREAKAQKEKEEREEREKEEKEAREKERRAEQLEQQRRELDKKTEVKQQDGQRARSCSSLQREVTMVDDEPRSTIPLQREATLLDRGRSHSNKRPREEEVVVVDDE